MSKKFVPTRTEVLSTDLPIEMATLIARRLYKVHRKDECKPSFETHSNSRKCELIMTWQIVGTGTVAPVARSESYKTMISRQVAQWAADLHPFFSK